MNMKKLTSKNQLFGLEPRAIEVAYAMECIACALEEIAVEVDGRLEVLCGNGSRGAFYSEKMRCWVLSNTAWWAWNGARRVLRRATFLFRKEFPGFKMRFDKGDAIFVCIGHSLYSEVSVGEDHELQIKELSTASYDAWNEQVAAWQEKQAQ